MRSLKALVLFLPLACSACTLQVLEEIREPEPGMLAVGAVARCRVARDEGGALRCALTVRDDGQFKVVGDGAWFAANPEAPLEPVLVVDRRCEGVEWVEDFWIGDANGHLRLQDAAAYTELLELSRNRVIIDLTLDESACQVGLVTARARYEHAAEAMSEETLFAFGYPESASWERAGWASLLPATLALDVALIPVYSAVTLGLLTGLIKFPRLL